MAKGGGCHSLPGKMQREWKEFHLDTAPAPAAEPSGKATLASRIFLLCFVTWCFCFRVVVLLWCFLLISLVLLFLCKGVSDVFSRFFSVMSQSVQRCFRFATQISCTRKQFNKRPLPVFKKRFKEPVQEKCSCENHFSKKLILEKKCSEGICCRKWKFDRDLFPKGAAPNTLQLHLGLSKGSKYSFSNNHGSVENCELFER